MTTATPHSAGLRVDRDLHTCNGCDHFCLETLYPSLGLCVVTLWFGTNALIPACASTVVSDTRTGRILRPGIYGKEYDPTRVSVGGLAEAHENVCARVERGELP